MTKIQISKFKMRMHAVL